MKKSQDIHIVQFAVDRSHQGSSAWLRMAENQRVAQARAVNKERSATHE
ncbi:MAG: hypothetical protein HKN85_11080 [Gammaproteobacteria bacterium]|nr:hypothetical protein [Gammaproteobacteria bacterium]